MGRLEGFLREIWSKEVILAAQENIDLKERVRVFTGNGTSIHVPVINPLEAKDFTGEVTVQDAESTDGEIVLNKHKEVSFVVRDIEQAQADANIRAAYTDDAGRAIAEAINNDIMALYAGLSETAGTAGDDLDEDAIFAAKLALDNAKAPRKDRTFVIAPEQENVILQFDRFVESDEVAEGALGRYLGFDFVVTADVPVIVDDSETDPDPDETHNLAFHKNAFGIGINSEPEVVAQYKAEYLGTLVVVNINYGVRLLRDEFAVDVLS